MLITSKSKKEIAVLKARLSQEFETKDLGKLRRYCEWRFVEIEVKAELVCHRNIEMENDLSVLSSGCKFARQLQELESKHGLTLHAKWEMISRVWIEMLGYAANHCE